MQRALAMCVIGGLMLAACGDDDGPTHDGGHHDEDSGGDSCLDLAGTWTIDTHCGGAPLIGMTVPVTQDGCTFTTQGAFAGFTGTLAADGSFTMTGMGVNGESVECTGVATDDTITESCTGNCDVVLTK